MGAATGALEAPDEGVGAGSPHAVELLGVPDGLESDLGNTNGVGSRAGTSVVEAVGVDGVEHMRLVVGAVKVLAVPASTHG